MHNPIYGRFYSYNKGFGILYLGLDCKFVIVFFAPTAKCCYMNNIEPSSILTFTSLFFFCFCFLSLEGCFETVLQSWVIWESDSPWKHHSTCSTECLFEVFVHRDYPVRHQSLLIALGPHNAVLFCDWGRHNRITLYSVGGFVCQEQEANYSMWICCY